MHQAGLIVQAAQLDRDLYRDKWLQQKGSGAAVKAYKKALSVDQEKCIPVMNNTELILILDHIKALSGLRGKRSSVIKQRTGAKKLHLAVHFMSEYDLRAGAVESIEIQDGYFSY